MMKNKLFTLTLASAVLASAVCVPTARAQDDDTVAALPAVLVFTKGGAEQRSNVYLLSEKDGQITYTLSLQDSRGERANLSGLDQIAYVLTDGIVEASQLFVGKDFKKALPLLEKETEWLQKLAGIPNSPYYDLMYKRIFSLQELGRYDDALALYEKLDKSKLRPYQAGMLAPIPAWPIYKAKQWDRVITVCEGLRQTVEDLPLAAQVRISFLLGEAYSRSDTTKALSEYHKAMTLDGGESADIVAQAALGALGVYDRDDQVKEFFRLRGRPEFVESAGYTIPTRAAAWIAKMIDAQQPNGVKLPAAHRRYLEVYEMFDTEKDEEPAKPAGDADAEAEAEEPAEAAEPAKEAE